MGHLELNPFLPLLADALLGSIGLLARACSVLRRHAVEGLTADLDRCEASLDSDTARATALVEALGYRTVQVAVATAQATGRPLRKVLIDEGAIDEARLDEVWRVGSTTTLGSRRQDMNTAPRGMRQHVGIFGRRNAGKTPLVNALCGQTVSVVSDVAGTTTDPVEKAAELHPLGPVVFIDTPGSDDEGPLGDLRVARMRAILERVDAAVLVADVRVFGDAEENLLAELGRRGIPVIVTLNKADLAPPDASLVARLSLSAVAVVATSAIMGDGVDVVQRSLVETLLVADEPASLLADLVPPGRVCVMVVPIDPEAPKGRLILPQVQAIRDVLDHDAMTLVVKERELRAALALLTSPPALVVTDSQAFLKVTADTPHDVPLTSFSILLARHQGQS